MHYQDPVTDILFCFIIASKWFCHRNQYTKPNSVHLDFIPLLAYYTSHSDFFFQSVQDNPLRVQSLCSLLTVSAVTVKGNEYLITGF